MEKYNRNIANNPRVEMIHVSQDNSSAAASKWATSGKFPWLTVLPEDVNASGLNRFKNGNFVPDYTLISSDGRKMGSGVKVFDQVTRL